MRCSRHVFFQVILLLANGVFQETFPLFVGVPFFRVSLHVHSPTVGHGIVRLRIMYIHPR